MLVPLNIIISQTFRIKIRELMNSIDVAVSEMLKINKNGVYYVINA